VLDLNQRAGIDVAKILRGAKADLPVAETLPSGDVMTIAAAVVRSLGYVAPKHANKQPSRHLVYTPLL
jgi:hypothetical protein